MRRAPALLPALCAFLLAAAAPPGAAASSPDCAGYPEPRLFLESQSWWRDPGSDEVRHVHSGTCFPYRQVLDGRVTFDIVTSLHEYPGEMLRFVRVQAASDQGGVQTLATVEPRYVCDSRDCTFVTPVTVDVGALPAGTYEFRIHAERRPGIVSKPWSLATNGWLACVRSCAGFTPQSVDAWQTEGRGYYKTAAGSVKGYINARVRDALAWRPLDGLPQARSGTWCPTVETRRGAGDEDVDSSFASVDPHFHAVPEDRGRVLLDQPGPYRGPLCVDTRALADGAHKLFLRAHHADADGELWGAVAVPFTVANGAPGEPPSPPPPAQAVTITRPVTGARLAGWQRFDASVPDGTARVDYVLDGTVKAWDATPENGFDEPWDTRTVGNGEHAVVARARDAAGASTDSEPVTFTVANP
jgi:hypothetical protein